jgi:hypothetical protein
MGHLQWETARLARLDTATESYRVELEPVEQSPADARARARTTQLEAIRERAPSGAGWPWLRWLIIAVVILIALAIAMLVWGDAFQKPYNPGLFY